MGELQYDELKEDHDNVKNELEKYQVDKALSDSEKEARKKLEETQKPGIIEGMDLDEEDDDEFKECIDGLNEMKLNQATGGTKPKENRFIRIEHIRCNLCAFSSEFPVEIKKHKNTVHKPSFCPFCNRQFFIFEELKDHIESEHKESPK